MSAEELRDCKLRMIVNRGSRSETELYLQKNWEIVD